MKWAAFGFLAVLTFIYFVLIPTEFGLAVAMSEGNMLTAVPVFVIMAVAPSALLFFLWRAAIRWAMAQLPAP